MTCPFDGQNPDAHAVSGVRIGVLGAQSSEPSSPESPSVERVSARRAAGGVERLKQRADFLACAKGRKQHQRAFVLQARRRDADDAPSGPEFFGSELADVARVGFTVTKKTGNSVVRNRIRRRLREAIRLAGPAGLQAGCDYVLIGRREALAASFVDLRGEVEHAFRKISDGGRADARTERPPKAARSPRVARSPQAAAPKTRPPKDL